MRDAGKHDFKINLATRELEVSKFHESELYFKSEVTDRKTGSDLGRGQIIQILKHQTRYVPTVNTNWH